MNGVTKIRRAFNDYTRLVGQYQIMQKLSEQTTVMYEDDLREFRLRVKDPEGVYETLYLTEAEMRSLYKYIQRVLIDE